MITHNGLAQIFPMSSLIHYIDKSYPYYTTHAYNDIVPVTLMPYSRNATNTSPPPENNTIILQATRTKIQSNLSNIPLNITTELFSTSWNNISNFKSEENTLITSSSNDQPITAEPWTRKYEDVFGSYGLKAAPSRMMPQKVKKLKPKYDQVAFVYPPAFPHPPPSFSHPHPPPLPLTHPSHPPHPNHYVIMKPYDGSGEMHKLDLNPLVPPSNEVTIDYYVTSSSPTYFEEPEVTYFPPGVEHINPLDSDIMHTKKHYSKNIIRPQVNPSPTPPQPHAYHPYPFYNQQQMYVKPTPSYPPVKKFIATVRPIYASPQPPPPGHTHTTHIIKYTTPSNSRYRVLPTALVDPMADSLQPLVDHPPMTIMGAAKPTPPSHDLFVPPRIPPLYYHDYHNPYATGGPYTLHDIKHNRNLLKQFNRFVNQKEKKKNKRKKNEADDEDDDKATKEDYENDEYDDKNDKENGDNDDVDDDDESSGKRRHKKKANRHKNNKLEESRLESITRLYPKYKPKIKKNVKDPFSYSEEAYDKYYPTISSIPKNHKLEQIDYGTWEKKGIAGESLENNKLYDDYKSQGSNRVDVEHVSFLLFFL